VGDADPLGDPPADALGDPPADALGDPPADPNDWVTGVNDDAGLLVQAETNPTMVMIITRVRGGAAIKNGVRRQKGFGP
jgi:hypothetical protein